MVQGEDHWSKRGNGIYTVIRKIFVVKSFSFIQSNENFLHENFLLVLQYTANIWCTFDMNKNIVTRKILTQTFANKIDANLRHSSIHNSTCLIIKNIDMYMYHVAGKFGMELLSLTV